MGQGKGRKEVAKKNQALERLEIEYVSVATIRPNSYNPNQQSDYEFELLCRSINEDGFTQPIVCQRETREFVDGEHRWTAAIVHHYLKKNGLEISTQNCREARDQRFEILDPSLEIPVVFVEMSIEQMRIATLRHNKARGSHDIELEAQVLRDLQKLGAIDWAQESLQLDDVELDRLLNDVAAPDALHADEFSEAWEPDQLNDEDANAPSTKARVVIASTHGGTMVTAMTPAAIQATREREERIRKATSDEERAQARKESSLYRLSLIFHGEEAGIVKAALGNEPAVMLVNLCKNSRGMAQPGSAAGS